MVPCESTAEEVSFERSHHRISSTDSKVRTTLHVSIIDSANERVRIVVFSYQPKKRRPNRKVRQVLREMAQDRAKQEEKAKKEERDRKMAEIAAKKENKKVEKRNKKTKV